MRSLGKIETRSEPPECRAFGASPLAACVLLRPGKVRGTMPIAAASLLMVLSACILPPDGQAPPDERNFPPEVVLEDLSPSNPITPVDLSCDVLVSARTVIDRDSQILRFRWVADNLRSGSVKLLLEDHGVLINDPRCSGPCTNAQFRLLIRDFINARSGEAHSLSLFITDAPGWAPSDPRETNLGKITIPPRDGGPPPSSVIEVRWVFYIQSGAVCPQ